MGEKITMLILGLVQGVADVFPVSSTAHVALFRQILQAHSFDLSLAAGLHTGSLLAIIIFFGKDLMLLWMNFTDSLRRIGNRLASKDNSLHLLADHIMPYLYGLSLIPVAIEGLSLRDAAEGAFDQNIAPILLLIINGIMILLTALLAHGERTIKELNLREFLLIGVIQGVAVLPGISRLGVVLCAGLLLHLKWQEALKMTFLLSVPVVIGALMVQWGDIALALQSQPYLTASFIGGNLFAGIGSWFGMKILNSRLLERRKLAFFGYYCLMLGMFSFTYLYFWK